MSRDWRRPLAWVLSIAVLVLAVIYAMIAQTELYWVAIPVVTALAAMLIIVPRPRNPIGWLLMIWALGTSSGVVADIPLSMRTAPAKLDLGLFLILWFHNWSWILLIFPIFHLLQVFPTGQVLTLRWRWLVRLEIAMAVVFLLLIGFSQELGPQEDETTLWTIDNPIGFIPEEFFGAGFGIPWTVGLLTLTLGSAASSIVRYRRAQAVEREQIKWLVYAVAMFAVVYSTLALMSGLAFDRLDILFALSIAAIPLAIAVAVLRFRLYDIDLVINRTLVYGALTVLLGAVYIAGVVGLPQVLPLARDNDLLVAGSTLAVAALFSPARRRIQGFVNRRFYRRRYNAQQTVEAFAAQLRSEVDLDALAADLVGVVRETLQPAQVSLWLRPTRGT